MSTYVFGDKSVTITDEAIYMRNGADRVTIPKGNTVSVSAPWIGTGVTIEGGPRKFTISCDSETQAKMMREIRQWVKEGKQVNTNVAYRIDGPKAAPKSSSGTGKIVGGAVAGGIIAGPAGAVVGGLVGHNSAKKK